MIETIIRLSVKNKLVVGLLIIGLIAGGIYSLNQLPIDAVPDITNNQVQVVTVSTSLAAQEVEQFITYPVEMAMANIPNVTEIRSISRFGLSVVTIVFEDFVPIMTARQFVKEQIGLAEAEIPTGLGMPELMPITTGLGEIYQYVLQVQPGYEGRYDAMQLRTIQDWIVKRQLAGTPGIIETSSFGGYLKQYEVALDPYLMQGLDITISEVFDALEMNNQNSGGSYIEKNTNAYYIRTEGLVKSLADIENIPVATHNNVPVLVKDVGTVQFGSPKRFGAMTMDGKGEAVGGITLMLKGGNSSEAIQNVHDRIELVKKSLPEGIGIYPYLDRSVLVDKTIGTVKKNLLEGGVIVIIVLLLLLGDLRTGLIIASVIPLAMLFALILMDYFGVSANLMSLGAIDFGIVIDGAVIVVEGVLHGLFTYHVGKQLTQTEMDDIIIGSSSKLFRSAVFGVFIILVVFVPIMTLTGIEGKMFRPMAMTFSFAVLGALILSLTYVPAMTALFLPKNIRYRPSFADKIMNFLRRLYKPVLDFSLKYYALVLLAAGAILVGTFLLFKTMGSVFIPTLEEGDLAMQMAIQPGSSLQESVRSSTKAEKILLDNFPEVKHVVSKIGTAEVPTDPMAIEDGDIMIILKDKEEWTSASGREELVELMKEKLEVVAGASFEFTQPIQLRFNELMTGSKADIAIKIFGENTETLKSIADRAAKLVEKIPGAGDVKVDQTDGLPQLMVNFNRTKIAQYGLNIQELNTLVRTAFAGETAGVVFENERKFDLVVRLKKSARDQVDLNQLFIHLSNGASIPMSEVASVEYKEGPMMVSRESARRIINIGINVRNRDIASLVEEIQGTLDNKLAMPPGYSITYGGQFENLQEAQRRLALAVPAALLLIFALLYFTFEKIKYALIIFTAVPFAAIGGVLALWLRDMPFSISAGVGFIALFGVAVLNGIVLISYFNRLRYEHGLTDLREVITKGGLTRLRPVVMTAMVAALGFLPMALSTTNGAEVQRPLATVVIGGLITATLLTLIMLPILYYLVNKNLSKPNVATTATVIIALFAVTSAQAQQPLALETAIENALAEHPVLKNAALKIDQNRLGVQAAKQVPPLELDLQLGQTNTDLFDYNFSVSQSFGNPGANKQRKAIAEASIALSESELALQRHEVTSAVKHDYYQWIYRWERLQQLEAQAVLQKDFLEKMNLQFEVGEVSRLEKTLAETQHLQALRAIEVANRELQAALNELKQTAYLTGNYSPSGNGLSVMDLPTGAGGNDLFIAPIRQETEVARQQSVLQQKQLNSEFSLGYFNQSIRPDYSFQGAMIGLAVPFYKKHQKALSEQWDMEVIMATNRMEQRIDVLEKERALAVQQATSLKNEVDTYGRQLTDQATLLRQLANVQLDNGEIDFFRYTQSLQMALQNELDFLDLQYQYVEAVLRLEYLQ